MDQLTIQQLIGPAVVIDVSAACAKNPDYLASPEDIARWEKAHGRIPAGSIVLFRTGWSAHWKNKKRYMGTDKPGDVAGLHFPGIAPASAEVLLHRRIRGVGIDTASIDSWTIEGLPGPPHAIRRGTDMGWRISPICRSYLQRAH